MTLVNPEHGIHDSLFKEGLGPLGLLAYNMGAVIKDKVLIMRDIWICVGWCNTYTFSSKQINNLLFHVTCNSDAYWSLVRYRLLTALQYSVCTYTLVDKVTNFLYCISMHLLCLVNIIQQVHKVELLTVTVYIYVKFLGERDARITCSAPIIMMYIGASGNNGVQDRRTHKSACLLQVQVQQIHIPAIMYSTTSHWALLELILSLPVLHWPTRF